MNLSAGQAPAEASYPANAQVAAAMKEWWYGVGDDWTRMRSALRAAQPVSPCPDSQSSESDHSEADYPVRELTSEEWAAYLDSQERKQFDA